jgi:hypothetical protein
MIKAFAGEVSQWCNQGSRNKDTRGLSESSNGSVMNVNVIMALKEREREHVVRIRCGRH